jgi:hypothetical protein
VGLVVLQVVSPPSRNPPGRIYLGRGVVGNAVELQEEIDSANPAQFLLVLNHKVVPLPAHVYSGVDVGDRSWPLQHPAPLYALWYIRRPSLKILPGGCHSRRLASDGETYWSLRVGGRHCRVRRPFLGQVHLGAVDGGRFWILALQLVVITRQ